MRDTGVTNAWSGIYGGRHGTGELELCSVARPWLLGSLWLSGRDGKNTDSQAPLDQTLPGVAWKPALLNSYPAGS